VAGPIGESHILQQRDGTVPAGSVCSACVDEGQHHILERGHGRQEVVLLEHEAEFDSTQTRPGAEARDPLEDGAKAERDEKRLQAAVGGEAGERTLDDIEVRSSRGRRHTVLKHQIPNRSRRDQVSELDLLASNPHVAPAGILLRQSQD